MDDGKEANFQVSAQEKGSLRVRTFLQNRDFETILALNAGFQFCSDSRSSPTSTTYLQATRSTTVVNLFSIEMTSLQAQARALYRALNRELILQV
jgi:hypothetical protein